MKGLLDTHAFIWWDSEPGRLSPNAMAFLQDPTNTLLLSVVSVWEIVIKRSLGKLVLRAPLREIISHQQANGIEILTVTLDHTLGVDALPAIHKDPFDRLLVAQAAHEGAVLLTADGVFTAYSSSVLW